MSETNNSVILSIRGLKKSFGALDVLKGVDLDIKNGEKIDILGITVESLTIPVRPGRNLAIILEVAAMSNRQKKMGYNAAEELMKQLGMVDDESVGNIAPRA